MTYKSASKNDLPGQNYGGPELDLARKAFNLTFQGLSFANFTSMKIDASDLGVSAADA